MEQPRPAARSVARRVARPVARPVDDGCRFPDYPWDLRTLIAVGAPHVGDAIRFLNINWILGRTGTRFDQCRDRSRQAARGVADLQFCLQTEDGAITWKREHELGHEVRYITGGTELTIADRLEVRGEWPEYRLHYRQPEADLDLQVSLRTWDHLHHWARLPGVYHHQTAFASAQIRYTHGGRQTQVELPVLLDHGWGRNLLPLRTPLRWFRYEVLRIPDGGYGLSVRATGPFGIPVATDAVWRTDERDRNNVGRACFDVSQWTVANNYDGQPMRLPQRWRGRLDLPGGTFEYTADLADEPQPVIGDGFLQTFRWTTDRPPPGSVATSGLGYAEQLGQP